MKITKSQAGALGGRPRKLDAAQCRRLAKVLRSAGAAEAASYFGITTRTIRNMKKRGQI